MQFIPIVERISGSITQDALRLVLPTLADEANVAPWSVQPNQYGRFLCAIFDEWVRRDVGRHFVQIFDESLRMWTGSEASVCVFRPTCGSALAIEHSGDLYSCNHFVFLEHRLGNMMKAALGSLVESEKQLRFGQAKQVDLPRYCRECEVRFACNGECPKHRFLQTPDGEPGLNYVCAGYKMFFRHIDPYMQFMARELAACRPPVNVMHWARQRDVFMERKSTSRNAVCPCGSGRKFKQCCLKGS